MKASKCKDCGIDTYLGSENYYMVTPEIWNEYGLGGSRWVVRGEAWTADKKSGMLCIGCLEERMGRKLRLTDVPDWPINRANSYLNKLFKR